MHRASWECRQVSPSVTLYFSLLYRCQQEKSAQMILTQDEKQENCSSGVLVGGRGFQIVKQETGCGTFGHGKNCGVLKCSTIWRFCWVKDFRFKSFYFDFLFSYSFIFLFTILLKGFLWLFITFAWSSFS